MTIEPNDAWYARKRLKLGRFVLATNDLDLPPDRLLAQYKNQAQVERGFRFLKDNSFRVSVVFLKKPTRIEALAMIMTLSLFIYSLSTSLIFLPSKSHSSALHALFVYPGPLNA